MRLHPLSLESPWSDAVHFVPLVGPNYEEGLVPGVRVLMLGESHYGDESSPEDSGMDFTCRQFGAYLDEDYDVGGESQFFRKLPRILARDPQVTKRDSAGAWQRAAYANFVQSFVGTTARTRPSREQWRDGQRALTELVGTLRPDIVLVMGAQLWNHITDGVAAEEDKIEAARCAREVWLIPNGKGSYARASWIYHPSTNYEPVESAIGVLSELISRAQRGPARPRGPAAK